MAVMEGTRERRVGSGIPVNYLTIVNFPGGSDEKRICLQRGVLSSIPGLGRFPGGGHGNPLEYTCLENPHGQRCLAACSPWGPKASDTTERLSTQQR